jgi:hypothetical protein
MCVKCDDRQKNRESVEVGQVCYCIDCGAEMLTNKNKIVGQPNKYRRNRPQHCAKCSTGGHPHNRIGYAHSQVAINKDDLDIIYECSCNNKIKIYHHFNYDRPLEVIRMCKSCHRKEHGRLDRIKKLI